MEMASLDVLSVMSHLSKFNLFIEINVILHFTKCRDQTVEI